MNQYLKPVTLVEKMSNLEKAGAYAELARYEHFLCFLWHLVFELGLNFFLGVSLYYSIIIKKRLLKWLQSCYLED